MSLVIHYKILHNKYNTSSELILTAHVRCTPCTNDRTGLDTAIKRGLHCAYQVEEEFL